VCGLPTIRRHPQSGEWACEGCITIDITEEE
jgi:hypothetical protein